MGNHSHALRVALYGLSVVRAVGTVVVMMVVMVLPPVATVGLLAVAIVTVSSTVYLEDDGAECDDKANADAAQEHQCRPLRLVWKNVLKLSLK